MSEEQIPVIRASEIGQYLYCARSWWLGQVRGYRPDNVHELAVGRARHVAHGHAVISYQALRWLGYALLSLALLVGLGLAWLVLRGG